MSRRSRKYAGSAFDAVPVYAPGEETWLVFLTDRRKAGAPIKLAGPFARAVDSVEDAIRFETEAEARDWCEKAATVPELWARYVATIGTL